MNTICYLTNNKNVLEMERRYNLLPKETDNFIIHQKENDLKYSDSVNVFKFDSNIEFVKKPFYNCTYLSLLMFYKEHPNYDYYWLLEDDLVFNGDFSLFFKETNRLKEDVIIGHGKYKKDSHNPEWYSVENNRIYGGYDIEFPLVGGFIGIQRWSNKFTKKLYEETFNRKVYGHTESFPITVALLNNMKIGFLEDIFKGYGCFYLEKCCNPIRKYTLNDLNFLPKNTLIHAIKF
jgi:hypothetical protein